MKSKDGDAITYCSAGGKPATSAFDGRSEPAKSHKLILPVHKESISSIISSPATLLSS
jgi:hypothetical protein